jgi:hypothetical protein
MACHRALLVTAALSVIAPAPFVRAQTPCTVELGQSYIDQGRYKQALKEFTCVIGGSPTEVDGYRGRIEAQPARFVFGRVTRLWPRNRASAECASRRGQHDSRGLRCALGCRPAEHSRLDR